MTRKKWLTALVAVLLIGAGIAGGFKIHETFFGSQTYSGNLNQLQEPAKSEAISDARNTAVVQAAKKVGPAVVGITTKVYNRDIFNRKVLVGEGVGSGIILISRDTLRRIITSSGRRKRSSSLWPMDRVRKEPSSAAMKRPIWPSSRLMSIICPLPNLVTATLCRLVKRPSPSATLWDWNSREP